MLRRTRPFAFLAGLFAISLVATFSAAPASAGACPNESLRYGPGSSLPDCRAYEQVSPAVKNGNSAQGLPGFMLSSEDGEKATYYSGAASTIPADGSGAVQDFPPYLASRNPSGESWRSQRLLPPESVGQNAAFLGATQNLRYDIVEAETTGYGSPGYGRGLFVIDTETEEVQTIVSSEENELEVPYAYDGASADGSIIFFESKVSVAPGATPGQDNLYMWSRSSRKVDYVPLVPSESEPSACYGAFGEGDCTVHEGAFGGSYEWYGESNPAEGGALKGLAVDALHAVSPSGDQIYFTTAEDGKLYVRRGLTGPHPETDLVSGSSAGHIDPVAAPLASFQEATTDGAFAFFTSSGELTSVSNTGEGAGRDLYRWGEQTEEVVDLTPDGLGNGAEVLALLGSAADGHSGFFVARGALSPLAGKVGTPGPVEGADNVYRFFESGGVISYEFVADLEPNRAVETAGNSDSLNWSPRAYANAPRIAEPKLSRTSRVDTTGTTLLFATTRTPTNYDNFSPNCQDVVPNEPSTKFCSELYVFEAAGVQEGANTLSVCPVTPTGDRRSDLRSSTTQNSTRTGLSFLVIPSKALQECRRFGFREICPPTVIGYFSRRPMRSSRPIRMAFPPARRRTWDRMSVSNASMYTSGRLRGRRDRHARPLVRMEVVST